MHESSLVADYPQLRFFPLIIAGLLTLHAQIFWEASDVTELLLLALLWGVLIVGWLIRIARDNLLKKAAFEINDTLLLLTLAFLFFSSQANIPLRILFWTHKAALENTLELPPLGRTKNAQWIGLIHPLQISKSGKATRIVWRDDGWGTAIGFAHCPDDAGCSRASFERFFAESEVPLDTVQLSRDWVAVSISGTDF